MDASAKPASGQRWRRFGLALCAVAALVALALGLAWVARHALSERLLLQQLARRGATPAALRVTRLDPRGIEVADLRLGTPDAPDLSLAHLRASWSLASLRARRLDALELSGLRLRGAQDEGGLHFGAAEGLWQSRGESESAGPALLPTRELEVRDATLALETPRGPATVELAGRLRAEPDGALEGAVALQLEHPLAHANGTLGISGTLSDLMGDLALALRDAREPARVAPATLRGGLAGGASALRFDLTLDGAGGRLHAEASGRADLTARSAQADLRVAPITFAPGGLQPAALVPALEALLDRSSVEKVSGSIEARGKLELRDGVPAYRLDVALREFGFESRFARVSGAAGALALRGPPLQTPEGQLVSIARLDAGIPLTEGLLDFRIRPARVLALHRMTWKFAGGELRADDLELELGAKRNEARLQAHGLDLAELLALVSLEGIDGTGRIDGELPVVRSDGRIRVEAGVLRARAEGGSIRYRPTESIAGFAASRPNDLGIAVAVFSDFRYEALEARLDGDLNGELEIALHLRGANPDYQGGHPIELNLDLEAQVADLVRSGQTTYRVPDAVRERLRQFSDEEKR